MVKIDCFRTSDKILAGVCGGLAKRFNIEPWLVRFALVASILFLGFGLFFYVLLAIALPRENDFESALKPRVLGVCLQVAERNDLDIGLTRLIALLLLLASFGWVVLVYVILHFAMKPAP
jgi:phage shock protein PspC (stress-responsive transcriptional regulator)